MTEIRPLGEAAILVELGDGIDPAANRRVHALADLVRALAASHPLDAPVPGYASLLVPFDPLRLDTVAAEELVRPLLETLDEAEEPPGRLIEIATRYGGEAGPDLAEIAELRGVRPADVVDLHASVEYLVYMLGFAPGFAYLGTVPAAIATPRLATPRPRVPAGSVGIAGEQTGIYPFESPGGWRLVGRTDLRVWDVGRNPPALLAPGDRVRFVPVAG